MAGYPDHNFPAFHAAAERLRKAGWEVINPAEHFDGQTDLPRETYIRADVVELIGCDAIALLPGWEKSRGATLEYLLARELRLKVVDIATLAPMTRPPKAKVTLTWPDRCANPNCACQFGWNIHEMDSGKGDTAPAPQAAASSGTNETILDEAKRLTSGDRRADYGHPCVNLARTAAVWDVVLADKLREGAAIDAKDVGLCMVGAKLVREVHKHDNLVDIAGYARTAAMVAGEE